ncbi:MAG TPA: HAMP domain-containing sensor histidine kinase [Kofleriaceae bacterium]|nr:HAMP domain-containing sensor histidine kinase [Kofleriaceae bacterium]
MTLRTRLAVFGALLPAVALGLAVVIAGLWLRDANEQDLDRRLLNQAAVESVGLFDGPGGRPHVHVERSPLANEVADFTATAAIYAASGERVSELHDPSRVPRTVVGSGPIGVAQLATVEGRRTLTMRVRADDGNVYTLWMSLPFDSIDRVMTRYYAATGTALGLLVLVLLGIQLAVGRRLVRRVDAMIRFAPRLREATGSAGLPPDPVVDELGTLREALRDAADRVAAARTEQDRLLADAAHELRTPLTVIRTELDLALRRERSPEELKEALRSVRGETGRLCELASSLLDLQAFRHHGFDQQPQDLVPIVEEACHAIAPLAEAKQVAIRRDVPLRAVAQLDDRAIRQAIDNLLANALRYAPEGSAIDVVLERRGDSWRFAVADRGPGIPAEQVDDIFEPFHRIGTSAGGGGLGLAIVREVMQRHHGRWGVDLSHRPGACVYITLPA